MPADPSPSLLITPDLRRRLQQRFDQAQRLMTQPRPDHRCIHELLAECLRADPGNILYLDALLANLRQWDTASRFPSWLISWFGWQTQDQTRETAATASTVLASGPAALCRNHRDPHLLLKLAAAADECEFDEAEVRYLTAARDAAPNDPKTLRSLARGLTRQGRFEDAVGPWLAVLALLPHDAEALVAAEDLRGDNARGASAAETVPAPQHNPETFVGLARQMQAAGNYRAAEEYLANAQAAAGGDLTVLFERENLRLRHSEHRLAIARRRAQHDAHPKAQSLVTRMEAEHNRLEIEILNGRVERQPGSVELRIDLARRLKQAGNFSGAIQRLDEAAQLAPAESALLCELGECWQHLRQFAKALDYYQQAVRASESHHQTDAARLLARYRAATLAAAMGQIAAARMGFEAILAVDPTFKDARERLDKLPSN